jgi:RNA polymerase sigma-70 factor (ECF subfamily)
MWVATPAMYLEDLVLVGRCVDGEEAAARDLFRTYQRRVHGTLFRILGSNRDIDDLIQETFVQVFRSLHGYRAEAKLSTWIDRIAVRVAYHYIGARKPVQLVDAAELEAPGVAPERRLVAREGVRRLYAALAELSPTTRIAFALHVIDGRSMADVAEATGATVTATKVRVWRARRAIEKRAAGDPILSEYLGAAPAEEEP